MAKPPRSVSFLEQPCQIEIKDGVERTVRGRTRILNLPVHASKRGKDAVTLPDGNEVEF